jgi:8-oxo-dGTP diphosphatase
MQLRDDKPSIDAPGVWGYFGGLINPNENPFDAATRELNEEIGYKTSNIHHLNSTFITDISATYAHAFTTKVTSLIDKFSLNEGRDFKFVTLNEISVGSIYSDKFNCFFPIVKTYYIQKCFNQALKFWINKS